MGAYRHMIGSVQHRLSVLVHPSLYKGREGVHQKTKTQCTKPCTSPTHCSCSCYGFLVHTTMTCTKYCTKRRAPNRAPRLRTPHLHVKKPAIAQPVGRLVRAKKGERGGVECGHRIGDKTGTVLCKQLIVQAVKDEQRI